MAEEWRDVVGYEGLYMISDKGNVISLKRNVLWRNRTKTIKERMLKQNLGNRGYLVVGLSKNGITKLKTVHRLVADAFIPNPNNMAFVNHKDECKTNNNADNLEWCNSQYNNTFGTRIERARKKQIKPVFQYSQIGVLIQEWESVTCASSTLHIHIGSISECCRGKRKTAGGYVWKYGGAQWSL